MERTKRIIFNTTIQYVKAVITTCLTLYSTRLILDALNVSDYGIYSVIAGAVAMLGFITNALTITTQRYVSFHLNNVNNDSLRKIFGSSLLIFLCFATVIALVLLALQGPLFDYALNLPSDRIETAKKVYLVTIAILIVTLLSSPFKALFIAHERISYVAIVEIADSIVKLFLAIMLIYIPYDKLLVYAMMNLSIMVINLLAFSLYALKKFPECVITIKRKYLDKDHIKSMTGFAGWTTYGMGCIAARNQGTAIVLNHFWGTAINAAYGVAFQVHSAISFLTSSIANAMNPQLMQAEGDGDHKKMLKMAERQSAFSTAIMAITIIPLIAEMPTILGLWLKEVPPQTSMFCRTLLLSFLCDQISCGLSSANQAIGRIRNYTLLTYTPKLLYLLAIWMMAAHGCPPLSIMILFIVIEITIALFRIPFMHYTAGLNILHYVKTVLLPCFFHVIVVAAVCWGCLQTGDYTFRFVVTTSIGVLAGILSIWYLIMSESERVYVRENLNSHFH